jgi:hypothetical protein
MGPSVSYWASQTGQTIQPDSWADCLDLLLSSGDEDVLYRGHNDFEWQLQSSLERFLASHAEKWSGPSPAPTTATTVTLGSMAESRSTEEWALDVERAMTQRFRYQATRLGLPDLPPDWDMLGWWEVMQHNRVPTRLLDWTSSPFVALWFVIYEHEDGAGDMALWIYDRDTARQNLQDPLEELKGTEGYDELDNRRMQNRLFKTALSSGSDLLIPVMPRPFPRAVAQQSVLTASPNIASALQRGEFAWHRLSTRLLIREAWKSEILAVCRSTGVSRLTLFRDFDSLSEDIIGLFMAKPEIPLDPW